MKRVEANQQWSLFCPNEAPGLHEVWGEEFERLYEKYEKEGRARKTIEAQKLWYAVLEAQIETGGPFMCYKDSANGAPISSLWYVFVDTYYSEVESTKPRDDQIFEPLYGDHRILFTR